MRALNELKAAILRSGVFQWNPQTNRRFGLRVQVGGILMRRHFAANARVLVDKHTLRHSRSPEAHLPANLLHAIAEGNRLEDRVFSVQRVTNLII